MCRIRWTKELVLSEIKALIASEEPLNAGNIQKNHRKIYQASRRFFGSWDNTLEASGIDPSSVKKLRSWDETAVIEEIQKIHQESGDISQTYLIQNGYHSLLVTSRKLFGSYAKAVNEAGFDYEVVYRRKSTWEETDIIDLVRCVYEETGERSEGYFRKNHRALLSVCNSRFGAWSNVLKLAGISGEGLKKQWSDNRQIIAAIRRIHDSGASLAQSDVPNNLYLIACRRFGSWRSAVESSGFNLDNYRKYTEWSKGEMVRRVRKYYKEGMPLSFSSIMLTDSALASSYSSWFDSWNDLLLEAGVTEYHTVATMDKTKMGFEFQFIVNQILREIGLNYESEKSHGNLRPDFTLNDSTWIDAKLSSWTAFIDGTLDKYSGVNTLLIIYLRGNQIENRDNRYFIPVDDFYDFLYRRNRHDIVEKLEILKARINEIEAA